MLDGSRAYLHAVIDNFSRRILAWKVSPTFDPAATAEILLAACKGLEHNRCLPHSAFQGQTPDEIYFQNGNHIPQQLEAARQQARQACAEANRRRDCEACELLAASRN